MPKIRSTYFLGLLLLILMPVPSLAQDSVAISIPADSSQVNIRTADSQTLEQVTDEKVFEYNELAQNPESLMARIQRWILQILSYIFSNRWASIIIKFAFFALIGTLFIALINQILSGNVSSAFSSKKSEERLSLNIGETEFARTDYESKLEQALNDNRYRDAVRILYLQALQQLNEAELIQWKPDKTNHDYIRELAFHPSKISFSRLTSYYEYVEYGDFRIEEKGFKNIQAVFDQFQQEARAIE